MRYGIIYKATNVINGKSYIGQSIHFNIRLGQHKRRSKYEDTLLYRAIRKYGWENFKWEILYKNIPEEMLNVAEICAIYVHDTFYSGYNNTLGGEDNPAKYSEVKKKISQALKGRKHTEEHKKHNSESRKGKPLSPESVEKGRLSRIGRKHSEETKQKQRQWHLGHRHTKESCIKMAITRGGNKYKLISPDNIEYTTNEGLTAFCKNHNLSRSLIYALLNGKINNYKGWKVYKIN